MRTFVQVVTAFPPKVAVSGLVNFLKGVSSRRLRQEFPDLVRHYWRAQRLWSGSYFAGSVGGAAQHREAVHRAAELAARTRTEETVRIRAPS